MFTRLRKAIKPTSEGGELLLVGTLLTLIAVCFVLLGAVMLTFADSIPGEYAYGRKIVSTIGSFLMVGATSALIYRAIYRRYLQIRQDERISRIFRSELANLFPRTGLVCLKEIDMNMNYAELLDSLGSEDTLWWLDTYAPGHMSWRRNFQGAVERGAKIRMLILKPGCRIARLRAKEISERFPEEHFHHEHKLFHDDMLSWIKSSPPDSLKVQIYEDLLGCPVYLIERNGRPIKAYSSFYLNPASYDFPHLVWEESKNRHMLDAFEKYIKGKWSVDKKPTIPMESPTAPAVL